MKRLRTGQLRESPGPARYNSPDCPVYTGQCPVLQRNAAQELTSLGFLRRLLRYNSPDMSGVHRTVRCILGATATSAPTATCSAFNARAARAEGRRAHTGAPVTEQFMSGAPPDNHYSSSGARFPSKSGTVDRCSRGSDGAPDTVRCTPDSLVHPADSWSSHVSCVDRADDRWR